MGRRKTSMKKLKKKRPTVATLFKCLFCNHDSTVECTLDHKGKVGSLKCRVCNVSWETRIHYLTEPIDVYSEWIDATEEAQAEQLEDEEDEVPRSDFHSMRQPPVSMSCCLPFDAAEDKTARM